MQLDSEGEPAVEMVSPTVCPSCHEMFDADVHYLLKPYREICPNCDAVMRPTDIERV